MPLSEPEVLEPLFIFAEILLYLSIITVYLVQISSALRLGLKAAGENFLHYVVRNALFMFSTALLLLRGNTYLMIISRSLLLYGFLQVSQTMLRPQHVKDGEFGLTFSVGTVVMAFAGTVVFSFLFPHYEIVTNLATLASWCFGVASTIVAKREQ